MPVTIHYNGKLDDRARLADLLDAARLYCAEQRWMYRDIEESIVGHVERIAGGDGGVPAGETIREPIADSLEGILITPNLKADPLWFTFNNAGYLVSYMPLNEPDEYWERAALLVDTQAAGVGTHVAICEFLQYIRDRYMPGLNVYDETNYFETGDLMRAERAIDDAAEVDSLNTAAEIPDTESPYDPGEATAEDASDKAEPGRRKKSVQAPNKQASNSTPFNKRSYPTDNKTR